MASEIKAFDGEETETIEFVESYQPPIQAARYTLKVEQEIIEVEPGTKNPVVKGVHRTYTNTKRVLVKGERFSIKLCDICSVFPPDRNQGDHGNVLPHIVFSRKTLPWERKSGVPDSANPVNKPQATPWLALLIFHDDDPAPKAQQVMIGDLFRKKFKPGPSSSERESTLGASTASYADADRGFSLEFDERPWDQCTVVDVQVELFRAIVPSQEDLGWLAHSRSVSGTSGHRAGVETESPAGEAADTPTGEFSVMIANRLPKPGRVTTACLVSLEHMASFLASGTTPRPVIKADENVATSVRLVVLKEWSFACTATHETFTGFFEQLTYKPLQLPCAAQASDDPDDKLVSHALAMGYTALKHNSRWGDHTISWYRGPFLPFSSPVPVTVPAPPLDQDGTWTGATPICTADEALRYDPDLGMLDVSFAAAWQLGRLLAMRDKSFAYALYQWKHENTHKTYLHTHAKTMQAHLAVLTALRGLKEGAPPPLLTAAGSADLFRTVFDSLADPLRSVLQSLALGKDRTK